MHPSCASTRTPLAQPPGRSALSNQSIEGFPPGLQPAYLPVRAMEGTKFARGDAEIEIKPRRRQGAKNESRANARKKTLGVLASWRFTCSSSLLRVLRGS